MAVLRLATGVVEYFDGPKELFRRLAWRVEPAAIRAQTANRRIVATLGLADLALRTEARSTRHPSQMDFFSPFQELPCGLKHFPRRVASGGTRPGGGRHARRGLYAHGGGRRDSGRDADGPGGKVRPFAQVPDGGQAGAAAHYLRQLHDHLPRALGVVQRLPEKGRAAAQPGWDFPTGSRASIESVMRALDAYVPDKMAHLPITFLKGPGTARRIRSSGLMGAAAAASLPSDPIPTSSEHHGKGGTPSGTPPPHQAGSNRPPLSPPQAVLFSGSYCRSGWFRCSQNSPARTHPCS